MTTLHDEKKKKGAEETIDARSDQSFNLNYNLRMFHIDLQNINYMYITIF